MRAFLLGATVLALAACGSTSNDDDMTPEDPVDPQDPTDPEDPPTPDESARDSDELAAILAAHVRGEFPMQLAAAQISEMQFPEGFSLTGQTDLQYEGVGTQGGLSYAFTYFCNDGTTTHTVVPCDGSAHHSHIKFTVTGSQAMDTIAMDEINRVVDWEIRDLTLDKARFRGPDGMSLKTAVTTNGEPASYKVQFNAVYEQVRYLSGYAFPTFGTIDFTVNTERMRGADHRIFNSTAKLTFGASGVPTTLVIDGAITYTLNLTTGAVTKL
jgi:hypothetical protein